MDRMTEEELLAGLQGLRRRRNSRLKPEVDEEGEV